MAYFESSTPAHFTKMIFNDNIRFQNHQNGSCLQINCHLFQWIYFSTIWYSPYCMIQDMVKGSKWNKCLSKVIVICFILYTETFLRFSLERKNACPSLNFLCNIFSGTLFTFSEHNDIFWTGCQNKPLQGVK